MDPNDETVMLRRMVEGLREDFAGDLKKRHLTLGKTWRGTERRDGRKGEKGEGGREG